MWKDVRCGELTGPRAAAAAVQELRVRQRGGRQARQRFRLLIVKDKKRLLQAVFRFRIRIRIHVFFGLPDPDPLVRGMDPDPSIIIQK